MGLDISIMKGQTTLRGFRAGSYSGFHEWRARLAKFVGIQLMEMEGFTPAGRPWTEDAPFKELLNHSDCDGKLAKEECISLAADFKAHRLLIKKQVDLKDTESRGFWNHYREWSVAVNDVAEGRAGYLLFH